MSPRFLAPALVCAALLTTTGLALAQSPQPGGGETATETDESRRLFEEASKLAEAGDLKGACKRFSAAHQLNATGGTTIRLADCYEKLGQKADALKLYEGIVAERDKHKPERVAIAEARVAALKQELASEAPAKVEPTAPDPKTQPEQPVGPVATPTPEPAAALPPNRAPAYVALAGGGVLLATGSVFGVLALVDANDANAECKSGPCANKAGIEEQRDRATTKAWVSNIGIGLGVVGVAVGVVLFVTAKGKPASSSSSTTGLRFSPRGATLRF